MKVYINFVRADDDPMFYVVRDAVRDLDCEIVRTAFDPSQKEEIIAAAQGCEAAIVWIDSWDEEMFARVPSLRLILRYGAGYDLIDLEAATRHKVAVSTAAGNSIAVAEGAFALMMAVCHNVVKLDQQLRDGIWRPVPVADEVFKKTVGILGFGRIGRAFASMLKGFDGKILAYDRYVSAEEMAACGVKKVELDELAACSDVISCHCPLTEETHHIVDASFLAKMKPSAYIVNTARGPIIDEQALYEALRDGRIRGAGLDVYEIEPAKTDNPLFALNNVVVSPHTTSNAYITFPTTSKLITDYLKEYMDTGLPPWAINREVLEQFGK